MNNETIQPDVSETDATTVAEAPESSISNDPVSRREEKMAALAESRKAEKDHARREYWLMNNPENSEDDYDALLQGEASPSQQVAPTGGETPAPRAVETPVPSVESPATQDGWQIVSGQRVKTLMVNGQPRQITEEQYDRMLQKDLAGDEKLRRAAEIEQTLNRRQQLLDERERAQQTSRPPEQDAGEALRAAIAKHTELLLEGDVDAANEKMAEIVNLGRASSTPNIDVIASQAATRAVDEVERKAAQNAHNASINEGWETLKSDYSDVVADPDALAFADIQVKRLREENPSWAPSKVIIEAGKYTREKLKLSGTATTGAVNEATISNITADRQERKASIRPLPTVSGKRQESKKPVEKDMSPAAKIARMRGSRAL